MKVYSVRLDGELVDRLEKIAMRMNMSRSQLIRFALRFFIAVYEDAVDRIHPEILKMLLRDAGVRVRI